MTETIIQYDKALFLFLNGLHHPLLDDLMRAISDRTIWIPFYAYLLYILIDRFGYKTIYPAVMTAILITLSDQISVQFKDHFMRLRPCHDPELSGLIHLVKDHCGGEYGFISSHAANSFGLAFFIGKVLSPTSKFWPPFLIFWACLISYSRIYLGAHFPLDIIGGALLGCILSYLMYKLLLILNKRFSLNLTRI